MSNGGFVANPEQEPQEESTFETAQEKTPAPEVEGEGFDEVAKEELRALERMAAEKKAEQKEGFLEQAAEEQATEAEAAPAATATAEPEAPAIEKDKVLTEVEKILEEDLEPLVKDMSPEDREKFQKKGVEVSGQIANMVRGFKLKMEKALTLIRGWLQTIPGVNKFFLEQEAKIKADKILDLEEEIKRDIQNQV